MKRFKIYSSLILILGVSIITCSSQKKIKKKQLHFDVNKNDIIELNSTYTNIEIELTTNNTVVIDAIMDIDGLSDKNADDYFNNWNLKANKKQNKLVINSTFNNKNTSNLNKNGYYNGYFIDKEQLDKINSEIKSYSQNKSSIQKFNKTNNTVFDYNAYINDGNAYLIKWQKDNNESIGKRWFNKTKKERIALQKTAKRRKSSKKKKAKKKQLPVLNPKENLQVKLKKNSKPKINVRALSNRAIINKTLKIKIPKQAQLSIKVRHGKVTITGEIKNLNADLSYALLKANNINGSKTLIKSTYSNFEIDNWFAGKLETAFSNFILIKKAKNIDIISNTSTVSIDTVTNSFNAKGNFKMLSVDFSNSLKQAIIDIEDSKKVWIKLPKSKFNLRYNGTDSRLIHPKKYQSITFKKNSEIEFIKHLPLKNNEQVIQINAIKSTLQIYDIPWKDLKIKNLEQF